MCLFHLLCGASASASGHILDNMEVKNTATLEMIQRRAQAINRL